TSSLLTLAHSSCVSTIASALVSCARSGKDWRAGRAPPINWALLARRARTARGRYRARYSPPLCFRDQAIECSLELRRRRLRLPGAPLPRRLVVLALLTLADEFGPQLTLLTAHVSPPHRGSAPR